MSDEEQQTSESVLRPFEPSELDPLPPVQASSVVVPEIEAEEPPVAEETPAGDTPAAAPVEAPATEMVDVAAEAVPSGVLDARSDAWSPGDGGTDDAWFGLAEAVGDDAVPPAAAPEVPSASKPDADPTGDSAEEPSPGASPSAGVLPAASRNSEEITLPRTPFLVGVGIALLAIAGLFLLWQSAGADDGPSAIETIQGDDGADPTPTEAVADDDGGQPDDAAADVAAADARIADLEAAVSDRDAAIAGLEADLAAVPSPALRGDEMRRIVVAADASFVSVGSESVAVIGPFGGYAAIDPATNAVTASGQVASGATRVLRTASAVWITNYADSEIVRIDPATSTVVATLEFPGPDGIAKLGGTLAVASFDGGFVAQVDPGAQQITRQVDVGGQPTDVFVTEDETAIWVAIFDTGEIVRIDAATFEVTARITVGSGPVGIDAADGLLWVVNHAEGTVVGVDLATEAIAVNYPVGAGPTAATVFNGSLWVTVTDAGELVQLDPVTGETITRTPLGTSNRGGPTGLAVGNGSLWVAMQGERSVVRVTPAEG
jgi:DNA-binding beta-propeller fold protein YncE